MMISGTEVLLIVVLVVCLYLVFRVIVMPPEVRNILGIILAIVLVVIVINVLFELFPL